MKILLINQVFYPDPVATAQHTRDLAVFLTKKGHQVTVVAGQRNYENRQIKYPKYEKYEEVVIYRAGSTGLGKRSFLSRIIDAVTFDVALMWRLLLIPRQDVVVSFTSPPLIGIFGVLFAKLRGAKSVQWLMDVNPDIAIAVGYLKSEAWTTRILVSIFEYTLKNSQKIVVLDRWMKERIIAHGALAEQIAVIPPWPVQKLETPPTNAGEAFRAQHGLGDKFVVLYSGNHSIVHPLETLLEAAKQLRNDPDIFFLFIGNGLRIKDVEEAKAQHHLNNVARLPPQPRDQLQESLGSGHLHVVIMGNSVAGLVHASKIYGVLATGRPYVYIGPRKSHGTDVLAECPFGFQVEQGDTKGLIDVIRRAKALTPQQLEQYEKSNVKYVTGQYSAEISLGIFLSEVITPLEKNDAPPVPNVSNVATGNSTI